MKIPAQVFTLKSVDRKELHQYYGDFDLNEKTVVDQMSDSLKDVVDNKVFSTSYRIAEDPKAFSEYFDNYGVGWQWNSGTHIQLYNVSEFADKHGIELENPEVFSYTNLGEERVYVFKMKNGDRFEVRQTPPLENPMESEVFKNTVGKAIITLVDNMNHLVEMKNYSPGNRNDAIRIKYDPNTKSIDQEDFIDYNKRMMKAVLTSGDKRGVGLNLSAEYLEGYLQQLETVLTDFLNDII